MNINKTNKTVEGTATYGEKIANSVRCFEANGF